MTDTLDRPAPAASPRVAPRAVAAPTTRRHWTPKPSGGADPAGHLTPAQIDALGAELDAIRDDILRSRGAGDAAYIRRLIAFQRRLEVGSRVVLLFGRHPLAWLVGTAGLSVSKVLENMEIGHNVMHGQWDWMRDSRIHSRTWEWDNVTPSVLWKHSHNELHHTWTNVLGKDHDLGYGILRVDPDQRWRPEHLLAPVTNVLNAAFFQYGIAFYDLQPGRILAGRASEADRERWATYAPAVLRKIARHTLRDYVLHPAVSGPGWKATLAANVTANLARNLWTNAVIVCGHFPAGVQTFAKEGIEDESRGEWYVRQMTGSVNLTGGPLFHIATGNLSHQIEHHMYPDLPSNRYAEAAVRVRAVARRYDLPYVAGPMPRMLPTVWAKVVRYSVPNGWWGDLRRAPARTLGSAVGAGVRALTGRRARG